MLFRSGKELEVEMVFPSNYSVVVSITPEERDRWMKEYTQDPYFRQIMKQLEGDGPKGIALSERYSREADGLLYFRDNGGNTRLAVPAGLVEEVIREEHDTITESAHGGFHKTYNHIASRFYWPSMSRKIKKYVSTCDVCQKIKPRRHGPVGLLNPIPIPTQPFEVISMDFISELP